MKTTYYFFRYLYSLNHWEGCETITLFERYYTRRIGIRTAWNVAKIIAA